MTTFTDRARLEKDPSTTPGPGWWNRNQSNQDLVDAGIEYLVPPGLFDGIASGLNDEIQGRVDAAAAAGGGRVILPDGTGAWDPAVEVNLATGVYIVGRGAGRTRLVAPSGSAIRMINMLGATGDHIHHCGVEGVTLDMQADEFDAGGYANCITVGFCDDWLVRDVELHRAGFEGLQARHAGRVGHMVRISGEENWGELIHLGDPDGGETMEWYWLRDCYALNSRDDGYGFTTGVKYIFLNDCVADGTVDGAGFDFAGVQHVRGHNLFARNCAQHPFRFLTYLGEESYDIVLEGGEASGIAAGMTGVNVFNANTTHADEPIVIRGMRIDSGAEVGVYSAGSRLILENLPMKGSGTGVKFDGTAPNPGLGVTLRDIDFDGHALALFTNNGANNGPIDVYSPTFRDVTAICDYPQRITRWGDTLIEVPFCRGANYQTAGTSLTQIDESLRLKVAAGQRFNVRAYVSDAGGGGNAEVQLYNVTAGAGIVTKTIAGGFTGWVDIASVAAWEHILTVDTELTLFYRRTTANGPLTVKSATIQLG